MSLLPEMDCGAIIKSLTRPERVFGKQESFLKNEFRAIHSFGDTNLFMAPVFAKMGKNCKV